VKAAKKRSARFPAPSGEQRKTLGDIDAAIPGAGRSDERICWRFKHVDNDSPWGIDKLTPEEMTELLSKLQDVETQTINELFHNGDEPGKHYECDRLPNKLASERLAALGLTDMTRVSRLRFGGKPRLYGFLLGNVFHILWWDQKHEIWPSQKKHT
jgi:hypothetical protein